MPVAREKILVADDEKTIQRMITLVLTAEGYQVTAVSDGLEAVETARSEHFDLFLTDIRMPHLSGLEAYRRIKEFDPDVAAVIITGFGTMELAIQGITLGVSGFLAKPFDGPQLLDVVNRALERKRLERENARLRALIPLFELSKAFMGTIRLEDLLEKIVRTAAEETGSERSSLMLLDEQRGELIVRAAV
ncbi:response regulator [Candidatus Sumerlaeota bacterium]|nr:response regulator [Candidatus Sumerlaeota bacterium]